MALTTQRIVSLVLLTAAALGSVCAAGAPTQSLEVPGIVAPLHWIHQPLAYQLTKTGISITAAGKTDKYIHAGGGYAPDNAPLLVFDATDGDFIFRTAVSHPMPMRCRSTRIRRICSSQGSGMLSICMNRATARGGTWCACFISNTRGALKVGLIAQCPEGKSATIHFSDVRYRAGRVQDVWKGGICITVLLAHVSYRFYERPFLRFKRRFTFIPSRDC